MQSYSCTCDAYAPEGEEVEDVWARRQSGVSAEVAVNKRYLYA